MALRPLVISGGGLAFAAALPPMLAFGLAGRPDVVRGIALGLVVGLLNSLLLARKLDRAIDGRDPWYALQRTMPRNMLLRFAVIGVVCAAAARTPGIHVAGLVGGLGLSLVVGIFWAAWAVAARWRKEDGLPVYQKVESERGYGSRV